MGHSIWNAKANSIVLNLMLCLVIVISYSCGGGGGGGDSSDTGSVSFSLALQDPGVPRAFSRQTSDSSSVSFECQTPQYEITTIEAQVKNQNGDILASGEFDCEARQGQIDGIDPGSNYTVCIFAIDSDDSILFEGESDPFAVVAGEQADAGLILLKSINARLDGDFIGTGFGFDNEFFSYWSALFEAEFDGSGEGNFINLETSDDSSGGGPLTYDLDFDGSMSAILSDGTVFNGILSPDNNIIAAADTDSSEDFFVEMDVVIKKSTGLTNSILNGDYIGVRIGSFPSTALTSLNFDGDGNGAFEFIESSIEFTDRGSFTYTVEPAGDVNITGISSGNITSKGIVSFDGTVVSLVDTQSFGNFEDIDMTVLIKASSGLSADAIDGEYIGVSFGVPVGESSRIPPQANISEITADGSGIIAFDFLTDPTTYTVASNGRIRIGPEDDPFYEGIVSQNGDIFTFVDTQDSGDDFIEMGVAVKKTQ